MILSADTQEGAQVARQLAIISGEKARWNQPSRDHAHQEISPYLGRSACDQALMGAANIIGDTTPGALPHAAAASANSSAISTSSRRALRLLILWNALTMRTEPEVCMKPKMLSAPVPVSSFGLPAVPDLPSKKNEIGTSSASEMRCSRPAPMRFTPFSYLCTCWNVPPIRSASSVWERRHSSRRERTRRPTSASRPSARLARTCLSTTLACFMICVFAVCCTSERRSPEHPPHSCYFRATQKQP